MGLFICFLPYFPYSDTCKLSCTPKSTQGLTRQSRKIIDKSPHHRSGACSEIWWQFQGLMVSTWEWSHLPTSNNVIVCSTGNILKISHVLESKSPTLCTDGRGGGIYFYFLLVQYGTLETYSVDVVVKRSMFWFCFFSFTSGCRT